MQQLNCSRCGGRLDAADKVESLHCAGAWLCPLCSDAEYDARDKTDEPQIVAMKVGIKPRHKPGTKAWKREREREREERKREIAERKRSRRELEQQQAMERLVTQHHHEPQEKIYERDGRAVVYCRHCGYGAFRIAEKVTSLAENRYKPVGPWISGDKLDF